LEFIFLQDYYLITKKLLHLNKYKLNLAKKANKRKNNSSFIQIFNDCQVLNKNQNLTKNILIKLIYQAKKSILINTPYFVPTDEIVNALITASMSGVDIKICLPGMSDKL
jgi:cardiolipin synthase A/B